MLTKNCLVCKEKFNHFKSHPQIYCSFPCYLKWRSNNQDNTIKKEIKPSFELGYFIGATLGDGTISYNINQGNYKILLRVKDKDFRDYYIKVAKTFYSYHIKIFEIKEKGCSIRYSCSLHSKSLCSFIKNYNLKKMNKKMICGFLKGFFDAEGSADFYNKNNLRRIIRQIRFSQKDLKVIKFISNLLLKFNIKNTISYKIGSGFKKYETYYYIVICGKDNLKLFYKYIGFAIKRKQKRLKEMIRSYKPIKCQRCGNYEERRGSVHKYCKKCSKIIYPWK